MNKIQITEEQAREMFNWNHPNKDRYIQNLKEAGFIKKTALEEARGYFHHIMAVHDINFNKQEVEELEVKYEAAIKEKEEVIRELEAVIKELQDV